MPTAAPPAERPAGAPESDAKPRRSAYDDAWAVQLEIARAIRPVIAILKTEEELYEDEEEKYVDVVSAAADGIRFLAGFCLPSYCKDDPAVGNRLILEVFEVASLLRAVHALALVPAYDGGVWHPP